MTPKALEYQAKAEQFERRAKGMRNQADREHLCLARAYRMLAEAEQTRSFRPPDKEQRLKDK